MAKTDEILNHVIAIKEDVAGIREHLKTLNGKVATHVIQIEENRKALESVNLKLAKWSGAIVVILAIVQIAINKLF